MKKQSATSSERQHLDQLREEHPINGALQDLAPFLIHIEDNAGMITLYDVRCMAAAVEKAVETLLRECQRLSEENDQLAILAANTSYGVKVGNA